MSHDKAQISKGIWRALTVTGNGNETQLKGEAV